MGIVLQKYLVGEKYFLLEVISLYMYKVLLDRVRLEFILNFN